MRISILIAHYYPFLAGAELFAQEIAERLVRAGNEVDVITGRWEGGLKRFETINGVNVHRVNTSKVKYLSQLVYALATFWRALRLDREKDYALIHSVQQHLPAHVGTLLKKLRKKPHLITVQGGPLLREGRGIGLAQAIDRRLVRWSFAHADLVHVISRRLAERSREWGARNITIIPNGVDQAIFKPLDKAGLRRQHGFSPEEKVVISIARLTPVKGLDQLVKATARAARHLPHIHLLIIGEGPQREELERLIAELGLGDRAQLLGFIPHHRIPQYLGLADLFVLPSLHEGLGIAIIEAMACGLPVIGSNVDGIPDIIEDGRNGILVPPGDAESLSQAMARLLQDEALRDRFRMAGLETVRHGFLWEAVSRKIGEAYKEIVSSKERRPDPRGANPGHIDLPS